ncbi:hypothetical protein SAVIM338S_07194 [Streptomyces avidinii]
MSPRPVSGHAFWSTASRQWPTRCGSAPARVRVEWCRARALPRTGSGRIGPAVGVRAEGDVVVGDGREVSGHVGVVAPLGGLPAGFAPRNGGRRLPVMLGQVKRCRLHPVVAHDITPLHHRTSLHVTPGSRPASCPTQNQPHGRPRPAPPAATETRQTGLRSEMTQNQPGSRQLLRTLGNTGQRQHVTAGTGPGLLMVDLPLPRGSVRRRAGRVERLTAGPAPVERALPHTPTPSAALWGGQVRARRPARELEFMTAETIPRPSRHGPA